jgi:hypothetical protein
LWKEKNLSDGALQKNSIPVFGNSMEIQGPSSWKIPEYTWTGQSHGIHLTLQATQSVYLTRKVNGVPRHDGVVGEDGGEK